MRKHFFYLLLAGLPVLFAACEELVDPCAETVCRNGGVCDGGDCRCPKGYTGDYCEKRLPPNYLRINRIVIPSFPYYKSNGESWDNGSSADLVVAIYSNDNLVMLTETVNNAPLNVTLKMNSSFKLDARDQVRAELFDRDNSSGGESMGSYTFFPLDFGATWPEYIELYNASTSHKIRMRLYVTWSLD